MQVFCGTGLVYSVFGVYIIFSHNLTRAYAFIFLMHSSDVP